MTMEQERALDVEAERRGYRSAEEYCLALERAALAPLWREVRDQGDFSLLGEWEFWSFMALRHRDDASAVEFADYARDARRRFLEAE